MEDLTYVENVGILYMYRCANGNGRVALRIFYLLRSGPCPLNNPNGPWVEYRTPDRKTWVRCPMPSNTLRVHTNSLQKLWRWRQVVSPSIVPSGNFTEINRTVTCMVLKANDRRTSSLLPR
ncbi:hypothetical protein TNCV_2401511 [Trichonephila clavipes]|nr:hypothetical protein TNCV_2401511 [Trichonephila clavipes]